MGLRQARTAKGSAGESMTLVKISWDEQAEVVCPSSKTNAIGNALRTKMYSTLPKEKSLDNLVVVQ